MKINELLGSFEIYSTNEEDQLIKKSLVSKRMLGKQVMVIRNDIPEGS